MTRFGDFYFCSNDFSRERCVACDFLKSLERPEEGKPPGKLSRDLFDLHVNPGNVTASSDTRQRATWRR